MLFFKKKKITNWSAEAFTWGFLLCSSGFVRSVKSIRIWVENRYRLQTAELWIRLEQLHVAGMNGQRFSFLECIGLWNLCTSSFHNELHTPSSSSFGVKTTNPGALDYSRYFKFLFYPEKTLLVSLVIKRVVFETLELLFLLLSSVLCWQVWHRRGITSTVRVISLLSISATAFTVKWSRWSCKSRPFSQAHRATLG